MCTYISQMRLFRNINEIKKEIDLPYHHFCSWNILKTWLMHGLNTSIQYIFVVIIFTKESIKRSKSTVLYWKQKQKLHFLFINMLFRWFTKVLNIYDSFLWSMVVRRRHRTINAISTHLLLFVVSTLTRSMDYQNIMSRTQTLSWISRRNFSK